MFKYLIALLISFPAFAVETVNTVDGLKSTGYLGLGDRTKIKYERIAQDPVLPESFDWRTVSGVLPPARDQGSCGSCWSFAVTGALEAAEVIQGGRPLLDLSEQHMVSCNAQAYGCSGGFMTSAQFAVKNGLTDEASFPYAARNLRCKAGLVAKAKAASFTLLGSPTKDPTVNEIKTALINKGPLFITVMAGGSGWSGSSDTVTSCRKRGGTNHMIILVGYDATGWIIRNSWGENWGDKGYAKIGYGCDLVAEEAGFITVNQLN